MSVTETIAYFHCQEQADQSLCKLVLGMQQKGAAVFYSLAHV